MRKAVEKGLGRFIKEQIKFLIIKNVIIEIKNSMFTLYSSGKLADKRISKLKYILKEITGDKA